MILRSKARARVHEHRQTPKRIVQRGGKHPAPTWTPMNRSMWGKGRFRQEVTRHHPTTRGKTSGGLTDRLRSCETPVKPAVDQESTLAAT
jgi:hypothetical protein